VYVPFKRDDAGVGAGVVVEVGVEVGADEDMGFTVGPDACLQIQV
jgi:hypothetical protein